MLDLTAEFATVDHDFLMFRFECPFGLRSVILQCFRSYLSDIIVLGSNFSYVVLRSTHVHLYMADLAEFVVPQQMNFHSFADDCQIYDHCLPSEVDNVVHRLEGCISDIGHWISANRI